MTDFWLILTEFGCILTAFWLNFDCNLTAIWLTFGHVLFRYILYLILPQCNFIPVSFYLERILSTTLMFEMTKNMPSTTIWNISPNSAVRHIFSGHISSISRLFFGGWWHIFQKCPLILVLVLKTNSAIWNNWLKIELTAQVTS